MLQKSYIAITIGPIYKTFMQVRKTRELWTASYLFSMLSKEILKLVTDKNIIMPYVREFEIENSKINLFTDETGVGLFPDRIIFEASESDYRDFDTQILQTATREVANQIEIDQKILDKFFRVYYILKELDESKNAIIELSPYLDAAELSDKMPLSEVEENEMADWFTQINKSDFFINKFATLNPQGKRRIAKPNSIIKDVNNNARFESIVEISTRDLKNKEGYRSLLNTNIWDEGNEEDIDGDEAFLDAIKKNYKDDFRADHKYIAIVKADGDKIGATLKTLSPAVREDFSKRLTLWGIKASRILLTYQAVPIYIGGDDLLFFAPVKNGEKNILDLIAKLDLCIAEAFDGFDEKPTLSYGVSISYYKYPLFETILAADHQLHAAKKVDGKNAIAIHLLKHSGAVLQWAISKDDPIYKIHFTSLSEDISKEKDVLLNSVAYKLRENEKLFELINNNAQKTQNFFDNNFDEQEHSDKRNFLNKVALLMPDIFNRKINELIISNIEEITKNAMTETYTFLRMLKFLNGFENDHN